MHQPLCTPTARVANIALGRCITWRWKGLDHVGPFFDPAEVEVAMMRGNAAVVPHQGGYHEVFRRLARDHRGAFLWSPSKIQRAD
jgi:hypothetical protein